MWARSFGVKSSNQFPNPSASTPAPDCWCEKLKEGSDRSMFNFSFRGLFSQEWVAITATESDYGCVEGIFAWLGSVIKRISPH